MNKNNLYEIHKVHIYDVHYTVQTNIEQIIIMEIKENINSMILKYRF